MDITKDIQEKTNEIFLKKKDMSEEEFEDAIYWAVYDVLRDYQFIGKEKSHIIYDITKKELIRLYSEYSLKESNSLKDRAEYHKKKQKGLSPFCNFLENPVGGIETFNNSTCEELNEGIYGYHIYQRQVLGAKGVIKTLTYGNHTLYVAHPYERDKIGPEWRNHIPKLVDFWSQYRSSMGRRTFDDRLDFDPRDIDSNEAWAFAVEKLIKELDIIPLKESYSEDIEDNADQTKEENKRYPLYVYKAISDAVANLEEIPNDRKEEFITLVGRKCEQKRVPRAGWKSEKLPVSIIRKFDLRLNGTDNYRSFVPFNGETNRYGLTIEEALLEIYEAMKNKWFKDVNEQLKGNVIVKNSMNIREQLNTRDKKTDNKFDLLNLYESIKWEKDNKSILEKLLSKNAPNETIYRMLLKESMKLNESIYEADDEYDFDDGEVRQGESFFCDGYDWKWIRRIGDVEHLDFDNWAVWMAFRPEDENKPEGRNVVNFFVVDEDTGFIDWGPVETEKEAREFLQSKVNDWEEDLDEKLSKETDPNKRAELKKQIDELDDEIGYAIDDDDMYAQTSLVKKQKILQEGPKEKSNAKIIHDSLNAYLKENGCNVDVGIYDENTLIASIDQGNWKNDHQNFRNLVMDFFRDMNEQIKIKHKIDDIDDSDTFSADYKIYLQNEPIKLDAKDIDNDFEVYEELSENDLGNVLYKDNSDKMHIVTKDEALNEERNTVEYNNIKYHITVDGDEIQISSIHPYDDANYCWAKSKDGGYTFIIYRDGKQIEFFESESEDFNDILAEMDKLDKDIKPVMVHN